MFDPYLCKTQLANSGSQEGKAPPQRMEVKVQAMGSAAWVKL